MIALRDKGLELGPARRRIVSRDLEMQGPDDSGRPTGQFHDEDQQQQYQDVLGEMVMR